MTDEDHLPGPNISREEQIELLRSGVERWNRWRQAHPAAGRRLSGADLIGANLSKANLAEVNLSKANLTGAYLTEANLTGVRLTEANLTRAHLDGTSLADADLFEADLTGALFDRAVLAGADLGGANLSRADLGGADLSGAKLSRTNLSGAILAAANLSKSDFVGADLGGASLTGAHLVGADLCGASLLDADLNGTDLGRASCMGADLSGASLRGATLDQTSLDSASVSRTTRVRGIVVPEGHDPMSDGSDTITIPGRDRWLNWARLRAIGAFPLFGVSYGAFAVSLIGINLIGWLNQEQPTTLLSYPIDIPQRMGLILASTLLLMLGTTLYEFFCPRRIKEFSETIWVEEQGHHRLLYIVEKMQNRWLQWPTALATAMGGALAVYLIAERLWMAVGYLFNSSG